MTTDRRIKSEENSDPAASITLKKRLVYLVVIYLLIVALLGVVEVAVRLTMTHVSSLELFVNSPQQKAQVANQQQSVIFEGDPLLLWRLKPKLDHAVWDFTIVSTNAQSFRQDGPVGRKPNGTFRIICLGDSVTFGYRVPVVWPDRPTEYDKAWLPFSALLEQDLRKANPGKEIEVINMAVPGYTTHQGLAWLQRDINWVNPDLVVLSFGWNDVSFSEAPDRETDKTGDAVVAVRWLIDHSQTFAHATRWLRKKRQPVQPSLARPVPRVSRDEYLSNILSIIRLAKDRGATSVVLGAPYRDSKTNPAEAALMREYRQALQLTMQQHQIPYLQIPELTEDAPMNEGWFGELIHPNHLGHRLIASELLKLFAAKGMLPGYQIPSMKIM